MDNGSRLLSMKVRGFLVMSARLKKPVFRGRAAFFAVFFAVLFFRFVFATFRDGH
jgi:hypothetical protein